MRISKKAGFEHSTILLALIISMIITVSIGLSFAPKIAEAATPSLKYQTHVQEVGWQEWRAEGETAGTSGKSLRLEGIKISLGTDVKKMGGSILYKTHVQNLGWQDWKSNGSLAGTSGSSLRLEAIQIKLDGAAAVNYDVYYRVHAQNVGWMGWAKNGQSSGTAGYSYRLEAIQIKLTSKNGTAPVSDKLTNTSTKFIDSKAVKGSINYSSNLHIQNIGNKSYDNINGATVMGTSGMSYRLESFTCTLKNSTGIKGSVNYRTHVQNIGWQNWKRDGGIAGTSGRSLRLEAVQMYLSGDLQSKYNIYYQVHVQNRGWQAWKCNGETAGTSKQSLRLEAIRIVIVEKGKVPPAPYLGQQLYSITFKNYDGKSLETTACSSSEVPIYSGPAPTKASTAQYTYSFLGWSPSPAKPTNDMTYTARFTQKDRLYTVKTIRGTDKKVLTSDQVKYGDIPTLPTPANYSAEGYVYVFTGWDEVAAEVRGNQTYTANYSKTRQTYTVTFKNNDGTVLSSKQYNYGDIPTAPTFSFSTYTRDVMTTKTYTTPQRTEGSYSFTGWDKAVAKVTGNVTYTAQYRTVKMADGKAFPTAAAVNAYAQPLCTYTGGDALPWGYTTSYVVGIGTASTQSIWSTSGIGGAMLKDYKCVRLIEGNTVTYYIQFFEKP